MHRIGPFAFVTAEDSAVLEFELPEQNRNSMKSMV